LKKYGYPKSAGRQTHETHETHEMHEIRRPPKKTQEIQEIPPQAQDFMKQPPPDA